MFNRSTPERFRIKETKVTKKVKERQDFIRKYRAALAIEWSREQLANYLGVKPDSVIRRRLSIEHATGLDLPYLEETGESEFSEESLAEYEVALGELEHQEFKFLSHEFENTTGKRKFVITSAQNATPVHEGFLATLLNYCMINNAELLVIPFRYRNPTSIWSGVNEGSEYWAAPIEDYLIDKKIEISKNLELRAEIKMHPTAIAPLSGFDSLTNTKSGIFGHPKIQLKTIPTPSQSLPKILVTTGCVTHPNYTDSKAGHKGAFHHSLAALIVEVDENDHHHIRHVHGDEATGAFYDLDNFYTSKKVMRDVPIAALITGDSHTEFMDSTVEAATYCGDRSIVSVLKPEVLVWHDVEDFYARNHHHRGDDIIGFGKHHFGRDNVEEALQVTADFIDKHSRPDMLNIIVKSNHDEALDRWLREGNPKEDHENSQFYYYMKYNQMKNVRRTITGFESIDPFQFWCHNPDETRGLSCVDQTKFLTRDESFVVNGIEVGFHGDQGNNGTRGSLNAFSKIGPKVVIGHSHTPGIYEGAYQVGLSANLHLEYTSGPSSWMHTHCIIYPDGSRTLIYIVDGEWHLE